MKRRWLGFIVLMAGVFLLLGCKGRAAEGKNAETVEMENTETAAQPQTPETAADGSYVQAAPALYISLGNNEFEKYPFEGENTPEALIAGIAELTGWNLHLGEQVYSGKGGMTVIFASDSALFTGPPEDQKEEFHVYGSEQMAFAILDSVQRTLQNYASPVYPENVDIYIGAEHDQPLLLESFGITWPLEEPYSHEKLEEMLEQE